ncbi:MAG: hypothetical protein ACYTGG_14570 [Planctomycetota bacterium]
MSMHLPSRSPALVALILLLSAAACSPPRGDPTVSGGFVMGDTRTVSVGDEIVIRFPAQDRTGAAKWRLTSFDSALLRLTQRPQLTPTGQDGSPEWTVRFVARMGGITEVVLTRSLPGADGTGEVGERRRFRIRVR